MHSSPRTDWEGTYFDGRVAERHTVTVTLTTAFGRPPLRQSYTLTSTVTLRGRQESP